MSDREMVAWGARVGSGLLGFVALVDGILWLQSGSRVWLAVAVVAGAGALGAMLLARRFEA